MPRTSPHLPPPNTQPQPLERFGPHESACHHDPSSGGSVEIGYARESFVPVCCAGSPGSACCGPFVRDRPGERSPGTAPWWAEGPGSDIYELVWTPWGGFEIGYEVWGLVPDKGHCFEGARLGMLPGHIIERIRIGLLIVQLISEIKASGLRGRGGAGFPSGMKYVCP